MTGGAKPRSKGTRFERELVTLLQESGRAAERVPLSGAAGGRFSGDVTCPVLGRDWIIEAKVRKNGFRELYKWLAGNRAVVVKSDRQQLLVVLPLRDALRILKLAETGRAADYDIAVRRAAA